MSERERPSWRESVLAGALMREFSGNFGDSGTGYDELYLSTIKALLFTVEPYEVAELIVKHQDCLDIVTAVLEYLYNNT